MTLYNTQTNKSFSLADVKKMVVPPFSLTHILWFILQASYNRENSIQVVGLTQPELGRFVLRLYDKNNANYYQSHINWG